MTGGFRRNRPRCVGPRTTVLSSNTSSMMPCLAVYLFNRFRMPQLWSEVEAFRASRGIRIFIGSRRRGARRRVISQAQPYSPAGSRFACRRSRPARVKSWGQLNPSFGPFIPPLTGPPWVPMKRTGRLLGLSGKPSTPIDNKRAVLSWPRRVKIRTASRHQSRRFHTAMSEITPDKRTRGGQHETDVNDPDRTLVHLTD
jgi:hypothetical protein